MCTFIHKERVIFRFSKCAKWYKNITSACFDGIFFRFVFAYLVSMMFHRLHFLVIIIIIILAAVHKGDLRFFSIIIFNWFVWFIDQIHKLRLILSADRSEDAMQWCDISLPIAGLLRRNMKRVTRGWCEPKTELKNRTILVLQLNHCWTLH